MRFFTCVLDPAGTGISNRARRDYEALPRERGLQFQWHVFESVAILTGWDDLYGDAMTAEHEEWIAAGIVRLDNRQELERQFDRYGKKSSDLELVLRAVCRDGGAFIARLLGDFAFIAWDRGTRSGVAACDTFAVQKLFYAERRDQLAFASRAEALSHGRGYDIGHLAHLISLQAPPHQSTVYDGVRAVPPAHLVVLRSRHVTLDRFWDASAFAGGAPCIVSEQEAIHTCRQLLRDSIRQRVGCDTNVWAQLSGGLDSSSIVSLTQWLATNGQISTGLDGTVTFVDRIGTGTDEREYSDAVVARWPVRNELVVEPPTWRDEGDSPPRTDQPRGDLHVYPRDRRLCAIVKNSGGRVLLSGSGGDELFLGNMLFFADWVARGHVVGAVRAMASRAALGHVSFWNLAYRNALLPLLPRRAHARLVHDQHEGPAIPWLERSLTERYELGTSAYSAPSYNGKVGQKYRHAVVSTIERLHASHHGGVLADALDIRYPFLYRPLVEFALRLSPDLRARPHAHRWVLREAMRGILPEKVRNRVGKPGTGEYLSWSLSTQRAQLAPLTRMPILGALGLVDPAQLRKAFASALSDPRYGARMHGPLFMTLAVEGWLEIRSDRWPSTCGTDNLDVVN